MWPGICVFVLSSQTALREGQLIFVSFIVAMVGKSSTAIVRQVDTNAAGVRQPIGQKQHRSCIVLQGKQKEGTTWTRSVQITEQRHPNIYLPED